MFGAKVIITLENTKKIMFYSHRGRGVRKKQEIAAEYLKKTIKTLFDVCKLLQSSCAKSYGFGFKNEFLRQFHNPYHNNYRYYKHQKEKPTALQA